MAQGRIDLQPNVSIPVGGAQETRFAARVPGGAKSGLIVVTVTSTGSSAGSIGLYTSPDPNTDASAWASAGTVSGMSATGVKIAATTTALCDYIRWYSTGLTGSITCSVVVYAFDA